MLDILNWFFNQYFDYVWLMFWLIFNWLFNQHFDWFVTDVLIILTGVWAVMNNIDWDWIRAVMNEVNWYSAAHCKNNLIDLNWKVWNDSIEQKLLYIQYYAHEAWLWTSQAKQSRDTDILFERKIVVTECSISSSRFSLELKANTEFLANQ